MNLAAVPATDDRSRRPLYAGSPDLTPTRCFFRSVHGRWPRLRP